VDPSQFTCIGPVPRRDMSYGLPQGCREVSHNHYSGQ